MVAGSPLQSSCWPGPSLHTFIRACCSHYAAQRPLIRAVAAGCRLAGDKCAGRSLQSGLQCCSAACGGQNLQVVPRRPDRRCQPSPASPAQPSPATLVCLGLCAFHYHPRPQSSPVQSRLSLIKQGIEHQPSHNWSQVNHQFQFPFGIGWSR